MAETINPKYRYNEADDKDYQEALKNLENIKTKAPVLEGSYDDKVNDLYDQVMNRKDFTYDLNGDALWQQYKDQYSTQGKMAMMHTMGQAAALTGGYGSSYAQNVGQQAYQGELQQLNDRVPELYQLALSKYNNDQALLKDQLGTAMQMQADEYSKYQDALAQHNAELNRAQAAADTAYDRGNNAWLTAEQLRRQEDDTQYIREKDRYNNLANLISTTGYTPSEEELKAAGMSATQAAAYATYYKQQKKSTKSSSGGGNPKAGYHGVKVAGGGSLSAENIRMIQWSLGVEATGVWDQATVDASGYKNSNDCYEDWSKGKVVNAKEWSSYYLPQMQEANKISAQIKNMKSNAEKENAIRKAYESGRIDETMAQELLLKYGLA